MKTPAELIDDASRALDRMESAHSAIRDYATLLAVLMAGPDAETAMDGMHRVALDIGGLADNLRAYHDEASQAVQGWRTPDMPASVERH